MRGLSSAGSAGPGRHGQALHLTGAVHRPVQEKGLALGKLRHRPLGCAALEQGPQQEPTLLPATTGTAVCSRTFHRCQEEGDTWLPDPLPRGSAHPTSMEAFPLTFKSPWTGTSFRAHPSGSPSARASAPPGAWSWPPGSQAPPSTSSFISPRLWVHERSVPPVKTHQQTDLRWADQLGSAWEVPLPPENCKGLRVGRELAQGGVDRRWGRPPRGIEGRPGGPPGSGVTSSWCRRARGAWGAGGSRCFQLLTRTLIHSASSPAHGTGGWEAPSRVS